VLYHYAAANGQECLNFRILSFENLASQNL
jgi:hypothetical protein